MPHPDVHGLLLAAGGSRRLGQPKQLLELAGVPLVRRAATDLARVCGGGVTVMTGADAEAVAGALGGLGLSLCHNPRWRAGLAGTIAAGLAALGDWRAVLIAACDQPGITAAELGRLVAAWAADPARPAAARYDGVTGIPALFPRAWEGRLMALEGDQGARALLRDRSAEITAVDLPGAATDVDAPADVVAAGLRVPRDA